MVDRAYRGILWSVLVRLFLDDLEVAQTTLTIFVIDSYVYFGIGSQAALFLSIATKQPPLGSEYRHTCRVVATCINEFCGGEDLFTVGAAYAVGIAFAILVGGTSSFGNRPNLD